VVFDIFILRNIRLLYVLGYLCSPGCSSSLGCRCYPATPPSPDDLLVHGLDTDIVQARTYSFPHTHKLLHMIMLIRALVDASGTKYDE
jgi:hypothetical protein